MKKTCLVLLGLLWCAALPAKNFELKSPDGRIALAIDVGERIAYTVRGDGIPLLEECRLGLRLDRGGTAGPLRLVRHRSGSIDRTFRPAVAYKFSEIRDRCNTLRLDFRGDWSVEFRAYDDGVAYRFLSDTEGPVEVLGEEFALRLPDASTAVLQQPGSFRTGYEEAYEEVGTRSWGTAGRLAVLPALFDTKRGYKILVSESSLTDYPCLFLTGDGANGMRGVFPKMPLRTEETGDRSVRILEEAGCIAATTGERAFPWRYFVLADEDGDLVETTMTARLAEPCALGDTSWIEPGQVSWEFWNAASPYGPDVDFVAGFNTATYKYFIDFAARFGIPYIIMDEGWAEDTRDPYTPNPEVDLHELIRYGEERGVGVILWLTWLTVEKHFDLFERLSEWGVRGVKIDFMDRSDQWMVNYYESVAAEAARHRMVVAFRNRPPDAGRQPDALLPRRGVHALHQPSARHVGRDPRAAGRSRETCRRRQTQGREVVSRGHPCGRRSAGRGVRNSPRLPRRGPRLPHDQLRRRHQRLPAGDGLPEKGAAGAPRRHDRRPDGPQRRLDGRDRITAPRSQTTAPDFPKSPGPVFTGTDAPKRHPSTRPESCPASSTGSRRECGT